MPWYRTAGTAVVAVYISGTHLLLYHRDTCYTIPDGASRTAFPETRLQQEWCACDTVRIFESHAPWADPETMYNGNMTVLVREARTNALL